MISDEAEAMRTEIHRSMSPEQKLRIKLELYEFARAVVEASIKKYHPDITPEELKMELVKRFHGDKIHVGPNKGKTGNIHRIRD